jgi:hypothetical protein
MVGRLSRPTLDGWDSSSIRASTDCLINCLASIITTRRLCRVAYEWIKARDALRYVATGSDKHSAIFAICHRAYTGSLASKAERLVWNGEATSNCLVPTLLCGRKAILHSTKIGMLATFQRKSIRDTIKHSG